MESKYELSATEWDAIIANANDWLAREATVDVNSAGYDVVWFPADGQSDPDDSEYSMTLMQREEYEDAISNMNSFEYAYDTHQDFVNYVSDYFMETVKDCYYTLIDRIN